MIVTTSRLLSTGVDVPTCKNIVLARPVGSLVEFKQIIGRGSRLYEPEKTWFTIIDYAGAINLFFDPNFDGDPELVEVEPLVPQPQAQPQSQAQQSQPGSQVRSGESVVQPGSAGIPGEQTSLACFRRNSWQSWYVPHQGRWQRWLSTRAASGDPNFIVPPTTIEPPEDGTQQAPAETMGESPSSLCRSPTSAPGNAIVEAQPAQGRSIIGEPLPPVLPPVSYTAGSGQADTKRAYHSGHR